MQRDPVKIEAVVKQRAPIRIERLGSVKDDIRLRLKRVIMLVMPDDGHREGVISKTFTEDCIREEDRVITIRRAFGCGGIKDPFERDQVEVLTPDGEGIGRGVVPSPE